MSTLPFVAEQRVVLDNISWSTYLAILNDAEGRRGRITFDNGVLEIMSPSKLHEKIKTLIARMVETFTEEKRIECDSAGSTTFIRQDLQRALNLTSVTTLPTLLRFEVRTRLICRLIHPRT